MPSTQEKLSQDQLNKIKAFFEAVTWEEQPNDTVLILARREGRAYRLDDITPIELREVSLTSGAIMLHPISADPLGIHTIRELRSTSRDPNVSTRDVPLDLMVVPTHRAIERAVVVSGGKNAVVIAISGRAFEYEIDACGNNAEDLGLPDPPAGISIFEGSLHVWGPSHEGEYDSEWRGEYREPTSQELVAIRDGECPWPPPEPLPEEIDATREAQIETDLIAMVKLARARDLDDAAIERITPVLRYLVEMAHLAYAEGLRQRDEPRLAEIRTALALARRDCATAQHGVRKMREWFERAKKQLQAAVLGGEIDTREVDEILKT